MEENVKNLWLSRIKTGKVAVIESHYAPTNSNCIWLKDGKMMVKGNSGWEELAEGGGGEDPYKIAPTYPLEFAYFDIIQGAAAYTIFDDPDNPPFTYIPDEDVYVIANNGDNTYTLLDKLQSYDGRTFEVTILPESAKSSDFTSGFEDSQNGGLSINFPMEVDPEDPELQNVFLASILWDPSTPYASIILDTEYNTDKYPSGGGNDPLG